MEPRQQRRIGAVVDIVAVGRAFDIVYKIILNSVYQLEVLCFAALFEVIKGAHGVGEGLYYAVVGYGDSLVSPFYRLLYNIGDRRNGVHLRHAGMQVQLDTLFFCRIGLFRAFFDRRDAVRLKAVILFPIVHFIDAVHYNAVALFKCSGQYIELVVSRDHFDGDRICPVVHLELYPAALAAFGGDYLREKYLSPDKAFTLVWRKV